MLDTDLGTLAFRNRLLTLLVATTGSTQLAATANGFTRQAGSFLADGFRDGMELLSSGFTTPANNAYRVIETVSALAIVTSPAVAQPTAEASAAGRTLFVGLPEGRLGENRRYAPLGGPFAGRPYFEEHFVCGGHSLQSFPADGGTSNEDGLYVIKWWGLEGKGRGGIRRSTDAVKALFAPGTVVMAGAVGLRVRTQPAPVAGQIIPQGNGWAVCEVQIPWWALSQNVVAP